LAGSDYIRVEEKVMKRMNKLNLAISCLWALLLVVALTDGSAMAQTTAFTYQGKLTEAGNPANGTYDLQFKLFNTPTVGTGTQQGSTIPNPTVPVAAGSFTVQLDFGANVFDGTARYLEIAVRPAGNPNPHTILSPRPQLTSSPYAIQTINATQLGGLPANRYVATNTAGNAAIGTGTPAHRLALLGGPCWTGDCWGGALELDNASAIAWRANSANVKFGIGRTENGLFFFRTMSPLGTTTNPPVYDFKMDNAGHVGLGNLGIGTDLSGAKLNLFTGSSGYGFLQSNGTVAVGSFVDSTGGWLGTRSNHPLHFFTNDSVPRMTMDTSGHVGIGTTPSTFNRLEVRSTSSNGTAITGRNESDGFGVFGEATGNGVGVFGQAGSQTAGWAGFFDGRVHVSDNLGIGTIDPQRLLHVDGRVRIGEIPLEAWSAHVCFNAAGDLLNCNFSTLRAKTNVHTFRPGLDIVRRLRPISFNWKESGQPGVGLGAEEVAEVAPSLVERNSNGEVAGVKYERLNLLLINAIKEQQQQLANLNARMRALEKCVRRRSTPRRGSR
jgi:hypothetical protein